jgi:hypothetical protein
MFSGRFSVIRYSAGPIGFVMSRSVYSASTLFFYLDKINPIDGWSVECFSKLSTAER